MANGGRTRRPAAQEHTPRNQATRAQCAKHCAVAAREYLQRKESRRQPDLSRTAVVEERVKKCEAERYPLHRRQMQLPEPEESGRRECEDETGENGAPPPDSD